MTENEQEGSQQLADRIDHEELWRMCGIDQRALAPEQKDRLWGGIYLRRYASARGLVAKALDVGREFIRGFKLTRADDLSTDRRGCGTNAWHGAINRFSDAQLAAGKTWPAMLYTAKFVSDEVPRMILLFEHERRGLTDSFKMCAYDPRPPIKLQDNHLRCNLDVECRACPFLTAIESDAKMTNEAKDEAKAWTCATHILLETNGDHHFESFLRDKSDDAFEESLVRSFAAEASL